MLLVLVTDYVNHIEGGAATDLDISLVDDGIAEIKEFTKIYPNKHILITSLSLNKGEGGFIYENKQWIPFESSTCNEETITLWDILPNESISDRYTICDSVAISNHRFRFECSSATK